MSATELPLPGEIVDGRYALEAVIGQGGMGVVFRARNTLTSKLVAVKFLLPAAAKNSEMTARFLREAQAAGRIDHPNVVNVYDVGQHGKSPFIVMELLKGHSLRDHLAHGPLDHRDAARLMMAVVRGVHAAHLAGVVHRDLKPENIFLSVSSDGRVKAPKVVDFGISKLTDSGELVHGTQTGSIAGTPFYVPPERIRGSKETTPATDVYSLGIILYESVAGTLPFQADNIAALLYAIAGGTPRPLSEVVAVPPDFESVVMRSFARELDVRYANCEALGIALEPFAGEAFHGESDWGRSSASLLGHLATVALTPGGGVNSVATPDKSSGGSPAAVQGSQAEAKRSPRRLLGLAAAVVASAAVGVFVVSRRAPETLPGDPSPPTIPSLPATAEPERASGPDFERAGSVELPLDKVLADSLDPESGDSTDWKFLKVPGPGTLEVRTRWGAPSVQGATEVRDRWNKVLGRSGPLPESGETLIAVAATEGTHFLSFHSTQGRSDYYCEARFTAAPASAPAPATTAAVPSAPETPGKKRPATTPALLPR